MGAVGVAHRARVPKLEWEGDSSNSPKLFGLLEGSAGESANEHPEKKIKKQLSTYLNKVIQSPSAGRTRAYRLPYHYI